MTMVERPIYGTADNPLSSEQAPWIQRAGARFTRLALQYFPDSYTVVLLLTIFVFAVATLVEGNPVSVINYWGAGFWNLLTFSMQMTVIVVSGFVLAKSPPMMFALRRLVSIPATARSAALMVLTTSSIVSWFNWGFSLIFSTFLALEVCRRFRSADYRIMALCAFLPVCFGIEQVGISGAAPLFLATPSSLPPQLLQLVGEGVPVTETIFTWQTFVFSGAQLALGLALIWFMYPPPGREITAASLDLDIDEILADRTPDKSAKQDSTFALKLENSRLLAGIIVAFGLIYIVSYFNKIGSLQALNLNIVNFSMLILGMMFHRTPKSFMTAVSSSIHAVVGIVVQFPLYAGIFGMIIMSPLAKELTHLFIGISNGTFYPGVVALYSGMLGFIVPSGGAKFVLEAPYIIAAGRDLNVSDAWITVSYGFGEALSNFIQPFWMIAVLGIMRIHPRHLVGFGLMMLFVMAPFVFVTSILLGLTL